MYDIPSFKPTSAFYRAVLSSSVLLCLIALLVFGPSGHDDSHITYSAAKFFADGDGIKNINGEAVEQGSSFLHVVMLGLLHALSGISLSTLGPLFSLVLAIVCLPVTYVLAQKLGVRNYALPLWLLSLSTAFTYWSMGGLESTLAALTILYCVFTFKVFLFDRQIIKSLFHLILSITAFLLVRPESFFVLIAALLAIAIFSIYEVNRNEVLKKLAYILVCVVIIFTIICMLRLSYFGQIFPQPVYAKADDFSLVKLGFGLAYFLYAGQLSIIIYTLILVIPLYNFFKKKPINSFYLVVSLGFVLAYLSFIVTSGGDWMGGGRFFVPVLPLMVCIFCYYVQSVKYFKVLVGLLFLSCMIEIFVFSQLLSTGVPLYQTTAYKTSFTNEPDWSPYSWAETSNYIHTRDLQLINAIKPVIAKLAEKQQQPLVIASIQMGMIPYHLRLNFGEAVYFVDMRGLVTQHISACADFDQVKKIWTGIFVSYSEYFAAYSKNNCDLPQIDIVYDLLNRTEADNQKRLQTLADNSYHIVYLQQGIISRLNGKKSMNTPMFIAVRDELFQELPENLRAIHVLFTNKPETK